MPSHFGPTWDILSHLFNLLLSQVLISNKYLVPQTLSQSLLLILSFLFYKRATAPPIAYYGYCKV